MKNPKLKNFTLKGDMKESCKSYKKRRMIPTHTEQIECPECGSLQNATVEHTQPFWTYIHECNCGHTIMESEWNVVT